MRRRLLLPALLAVAGTVACATPAAAGQPNWAALRRPLHLPSLGSHGRCPVSRVDRSVPWHAYGIGPGLGPGPVYPVFGTPRLDVTFHGRAWGRSIWGGQKVLWFVAPAYSGPVLVRGRRLGGWQWLRFDGDARPAAELRIFPGETVRWGGQAAGTRGRPSYVRVRATGCYAAQIDGTDFSEVVVFRVVREA